MTRQLMLGDSNTELRKVMDDLELEEAQELLSKKDQQIHRLRVLIEQKNAQLQSQTQYIQQLRKKLDDTKSVSRK